MTLYEVLGREVEARHAAGALAEFRLRAYRELLGLVSRLRAGEVDPSRVEVLDDGWRLLPGGPPAAPPPAEAPTR